MPIKSPAVSINRRSIEDTLVKGVLFACAVFAVIVVFSIILFLYPLKK